MTGIWPVGLATACLLMSDAVRSGYDVVAPAWQTRTLDVRLDLPDEPVDFVGNRDMVERVVVNLVGNAAKFTRDGGTIEVSLSREDTDAILVVADTGIGIPEEDQNRLFTRFFRASSAQRLEIPGSGLGLAINHAIVEQYDGRISVESTPGVGTTFQVWLPLPDRNIQLSTTVDPVS